MRGAAVALVATLVACAPAATGPSPSPTVKQTFTPIPTTLPVRVLNPYALAFDAQDKLLVADGQAGRVLRVDTRTHEVSLVAGNGTKGTSGDGGPATAAPLVFPVHVGVDAAGAVWIADVDGYRIRKVDANGVISTVHTPTEFVYAFAFDKNGDLVFIEGNRVKKLTLATKAVTNVAGTGEKGAGGEGGAGLKAELDEPHGLTLDAAGNIFVSDTSSNRIVRIDATTGVLTRIAGGGAAGFGGDGGPATDAKLNQPRQLVFDKTGALVFADQGNNRVRRIGADGTIATVAGDGSALIVGDAVPALQAGMRGVWGVALNAAGDLFIASPPAARIRAVDAKTGTIAWITAP